jgi:drug efflux transport system ATP-binding protein
MSLPVSLDTEMTHAISLDRVSKRYGHTTALRELSLSVERGEMFGLIGPDGAGKTTAIRLMCGLLRADSGAIRILGLDPVREHRRLTDSVGYLSQRFSLYGDLSVDENIAFFAEIHGLRDDRPRRDRLLDMTQLAPFRSRLADRLSGGMKQKLALACTLIHEPDLILLDEPTTGVDPVSRREFWKLLSEFLAQGITIVMATPYLDEAERCSRVAMLHQGGLLALDRPDALRATLSGQVYEVIVSDHRRAAAILRRSPGVIDVQMFGDRAHVRLSASNVESAQLRTEQAVATLTSLLTGAGLEVKGIRPIATSLEDVFIARVGRSLVSDTSDTSDTSRRPVL